MWVKNYTELLLDLGYGFKCVVTPSTFDWRVVTDHRVLDHGVAISLDSAKDKARKAAHERINGMMTRLVRAR